jgi:hypothetical protein
METLKDGMQTVINDAVEAYEESERVGMKGGTSYGSSTANGTDGEGSEIKDGRLI